MSTDGRYVVFASHADNLVDDDTNRDYDIFVHDRETSVTTMIPTIVDGMLDHSPRGLSPAISDNGRYVAFTAHSTGLVPDDTNGYADILVHDRVLGTYTRISLHSDGTQGNESSYEPSISADGRYVTFHSYADNLVDGDTNGTIDVFVHDRETSETERVSMNVYGEQGNSMSLSALISADGKHILFKSHSTNLVPDDDEGTVDCFRTLNTLYK